MKSNDHDSTQRSGKSGMLESLGDKGPGGRKSGSSKPFAISNTTTARKGPSYYKDLYEFDAISELEEF